MLDAVEKVDEWTLTAEQFAVMVNCHNLIEDAYAAAKNGDDATFHRILDEIIASPEYQAAFGEMSWDEAYDRYEEITLR